MEEEVKEQVIFMPPHSRNPFHNNLSQKWWWELIILSPWTWFPSQRSTVQLHTIFCSKRTLKSHYSSMKICLEEGSCTTSGLCAAALPGFSCPGLLMLGNKKTNNQPKAGLLFSSCSTSNPTQHPDLLCLAQQEECFSTSPITCTQPWGALLLNWKRKEDCTTCFLLCVTEFKLWKQAYYCPAVFQMPPWDQEIKLVCLARGKNRSNAIAGEDKKKINNYGGNHV